MKSHYFNEKRAQISISFSQFFTSLRQNFTPWKSYDSENVKKKTRWWNFPPVFICTLESSICSKWKRCASFPFRKYSSFRSDIEKKSVTFPKPSTHLDNWGGFYRHNSPSFLFLRTMEYFFTSLFSPNRRNKAHSLSKRKVSASQVFPTVSLETSMNSEIGLSSRFIHSQNPESANVLVLGRTFVIRKYLRECDERFFSMKMRNNPGFVVFAADNDLIHYAFFCFAVPSVTCALSYTSRACWIEMREML